MVYLPNGNTAKDMNRQFTEEKDLVKTQKKKKKKNLKLTWRQKNAQSEMLPCPIHQINDNNREWLSHDAKCWWGYGEIGMFN